MFVTRLLRVEYEYERDNDAIARLAKWDGIWYRHIANRGYDYAIEGRSPIALFPAYPLAGRGVAWATRWRTDLALVVVSHGCLLAAFVVMAAYVARRYVEEPPETGDYALLAMGLLPTTFFFRMAYSEALFVLLMALALLGWQRRWPPLVLAVIIGLSTATRAVGLAAVPPLVWYAWQYYGERQVGVSGRLARGGVLAAVGCWGLLGFMAFQWSEYGDPLAFAKIQAQWNLRRDPTPAPLSEQMLQAATLEPIWAAYVPSRQGYWARHDDVNNPIFSLQFANPIYFLGTVALILIGWRKRWLNRYELLLAAGLLLIPYLTKSHSNAMASFGRFSAVVLPAYLVTGHILTRLGPTVAAALLAISAFFLGVYSALFAAGYRLI